jgi:hypothetical protein
MKTVVNAQKIGRLRPLTRQYVRALPWEVETGVFTLQIIPRVDKA